MDLVGTLHSFLIYGTIGLLLEVVFTGIVSVLRKNYAATSTTYLWMFFIYGLGGLLLEGIRVSVPLPWFPLAFVYMLAIYGIEFLTGLVLIYLIGRCPWHYGKGRWTILGLINLKYLPLWLLVGMSFNTISLALHAFVRFLSTV